MIAEKNASEERINDQNKSYRETQLERFRDIREREKQEKLDDIVRHQEQRLVQAF
jgi:hypothetical protein